MPTAAASELTDQQVIDLLGRVQAHQLPAGQAEVRGILVRLVTPAARMDSALLDLGGVHRHRHRPFQRTTDAFVEVLVAAHAKRLGEHEGDDAVTIHAAAIGLAEVAVVLLVVEDVGQAAAQPRAMVEIVGGMPGGEMRQQRQRAERGGEFVADRTVGLLQATQVDQGAAHGDVARPFGTQQVDHLLIGEFAGGSGRHGQGEATGKDDDGDAHQRSSPRRRK